MSHFFFFLRCLTSFLTLEPSSSGTVGLPLDGTIVLSSSASSGLCTSSTIVSCSSATTGMSKNYYFLICAHFSAIEISLDNNFFYL
ncbi:uncharacterized protein LOC124811869 isoform X2 [Hydra vulgaris]|uniref:uncharacterized protein LOC124811869 isoform X2 n=1 Tax=Hydra vulgaris TaxID=6087 RepID=UPI0032E9DE61